MEIYLIRHTVPDIEKNVCYGQSDIPLKKPYTREFKNILRQTEGLQPLIFSSPLTRCSILAGYLQQRLSRRDEVKFDDRLKELNFGLWELKKWDDIEPAVLNDWMNNFVETPVPAGESFMQLNHRVNDFIENALQSERIKQPVIIVTHGGVIRCFLCGHRKIDLKDAFSIKVEYGSVVKVCF